MRCWAGDHVGAEAVAGGGLLLLEGVEAFVYGVGSDAEFFAVFGEALNFLGVWYCDRQAVRLRVRWAAALMELAPTACGEADASAAYADGSASAGDRCGAVLGRRD